jgi:hypothetical protein
MDTAALAGWLAKVYTKGKFKKEFAVGSRLWEGFIRTDYLAGWVAEYGGVIYGPFDSSRAAERWLRQRAMPAGVIRPVIFAEGGEAVLAKRKAKRPKPKPKGY